MRKKIGIFLVMTAIFLFGNMNVNAQSDSYWGKYFEQIGDLHPYTGCGGGRMGLSEWNSIDQNYIIQLGGCGSAQSPLEFYVSWQTYNLIYNDVKVSDVSIKSSNEDILTAEVVEYDFSKEQAYFESFIEYYNGLSLDKFNEYAKEFFEGNRDDFVEYSTKPTWWEYNGYDSEPTWWEAYGFDSEPTNAIELKVRAKDLGKASITLNATDRESITINWTIQAVDFWDGAIGDGMDYEAQKEFIKNKAQGLVEILNNLEKYKDVIRPIDNYTDSNFLYLISDNEDLSNVVNALKGKDITVKFVKYNNGISTDYNLNGKDITSTVEKGFTYDHDISMTTSVNKDNIDSLLETENALYIDFTYHGNLPAPYTLSINLREYVYQLFDNIYKCYEYDYETQQEEQNKCNQELEKKVHEYFENAEYTLLYYNPESGQMEVVKEGLTVDEYGSIKLSFDHFSSYVLVKSDDYTIIENQQNGSNPNNSQNPNTTGNNSSSNNTQNSNTTNGSGTNNVQTSSLNVAFYGLIAIGSLAGMIYIVMGKKNKKIA